MLFYMTVITDLAATTLCLWGAFYLLGRGYPGKLAILGALLFLMLSAFFFGAYNNIFNQIEGTAAWRATCLIAGIGIWHNITYQLNAEENRKKLLPFALGIYALGFSATMLLINDNTPFVGERGNSLYVAHMGVGLPYILYGVYEILVCLGIFQNLLSHEKVGMTSQGKFFLAASVFPLAGVLYGVIALAISPPMPRLIQDVLALGGVLLLGISIARHQSFLERRIILHDLPVATLTVGIITAAYCMTALRFEFPLELVGALAVFVTLTHGLYDLVREFLERMRTNKEKNLQRQLRALSRSARHMRAQQGLDLLCKALDSESGFIAVKEGNEFVIAATKQSAENEARIPLSDSLYEDLSEAQNPKFPNIQFFAPSFDGHTQIALAGIGKPRSRMNYSQGDLELLSEVADQLGSIFLLGETQPASEKEANQLTGELLDAIGNTLDPEFIKMVEEGLRRLSDYIALGQSPLADALEVRAGSHIERGRDLQEMLIKSIELLRPAEKRPPEPLPRVWYNYAVLHDAYVEGVPNREIMARMYVSEGTFNRARRNAIRGLARFLKEKRVAVK